MATRLYLARHYCCLSLLAGNVVACDRNADVDFHLSLEFWVNKNRLAKGQSVLCKMKNKRLFYCSRVYGVGVFLKAFGYSA